MDAGEPVDVTSVMPPEFARGDVLGDYARQIGATRVADQAESVPARAPSDAVSRPVGTDQPVDVPYRAPSEPEAVAAAPTQAAGAKPETAPSPVEQNVRQAAIEKPDIVAHLDANAGPQEGKISDLLKTIDDEHQATLQDASLLQVAANCFISAGD